MQRPDGTLSGVTQSIDTWSFGCVLSVAATWVVLGFQGIRQYQQLRQLSPTNTRNGVVYDRFHDGIDVLPEIKKWHDYLRGHIRVSDTMTPMVLDLIERSMLQTNTRSRMNFVKLCEKLQGLIRLAKEMIKGLDNFSTETDEVVLKALLKIEEEAQSQKSSEPKTTPIQQQAVLTTDVPRENPRRRASMQIQKDRIYKSKPLGQTACRREILEEELKSRSFMPEVTHQTGAEGSHSGAITVSPVDTQMSIDDYFLNRKGISKGATAQGLSLPPCASANTAVPPLISPRNFTAASVMQTSLQHQKQTLTDDHLALGRGTPFSSRIEPRLPGFFRDMSESAEPNRNVIRSSERSLGKDRAYPADSTFPAGSLPNITKSIPATLKVSPPLGYTLNPAGASPASPPFTPVNIGAVQLGSSSSSPKVPQYSYPNPNGSPGRPSRGYGHAQERLGQTENSHNIVPSQPPSHPAQVMAQRASVNQFHEGLHPVTEEQSVDSETSGRLAQSNSRNFLSLPPSIYELPFDICRKRKELDQEVTTKLGKLKSKLGVETRNKDASLVQTFSDPRELVRPRQSKSEILLTSRSRFLSSIMAGLCSNTGQ